MHRNNGYRAIDELRQNFRVRSTQINQRLDEFAAVNAKDFFYELVYCLLTPQSSAENAEKVVRQLKSADLLNCNVEPSLFLRNKSSYIRFHNTKALHIIEAKRRFTEIGARLTTTSTGEELRTWLVANVRGLGWKEGSHFLRNIGYRNLAILDRHILRNLKKHGVIGSVPDSLTGKHYLEIEGKFRRFASSVRITMDELDLFFWSMETGKVMK